MEEARGSVCWWNAVVQAQHRMFDMMRRCKRGDILLLRCRRLQDQQVLAK